MKKKRKYIYLEKCLIICILQIYIFSFYDFLFFISLSKVELTRCMAELACLSLDKRIEEVRPYNKEVTGITYLRLTDTLKVLDELSDILYKGGYCDLNQSDNCKRGMAIIQRKLTDCDIISRAINESDKLNPAGDDE